MKSILFPALAAMSLLAGNAWAESNYLASVETPASARVIRAGQSGVDTGSEAAPVFSGTLEHVGASPILSDTGSEATPNWAPRPRPMVAGK